MHTVSLLGEWTCQTPLRSCVRQRQNAPTASSEHDAGNCQALSLHVVTVVASKPDPHRTAAQRLRLHPAECVALRLLSRSNVRMRGMSTTLALPTTHPGDDSTRAYSRLTSRPTESPATTGFDSVVTACYVTIRCVERGRIRQLVSTA